MDGVVALLADVHGRALRIIAKELQEDVEGLGAASRRARQRGRISNQLAKKLDRIDTAFAVCRHLTEPRANGFIGGLLDALARGCGDGEKRNQGKASEEHDAGDQTNAKEKCEEVTKPPTVRELMMTKPIVKAADPVLAVAGPGTEAQEQIEANIDGPSCIRAPGGLWVAPGWPPGGRFARSRRSSRIWSTRGGLPRILGRMLFEIYDRWWSR